MRSAATSAMPARLVSWWPLAGVAALAVLVGVLFLREPGFGDDLDYWSLAFRLHEEGLPAWSQTRFHDLRWPVWGVSWVLQAVCGPGLLSFYGVPILYLIAGALVAFGVGRRLTASWPVAWACALAFLFHPLLDSVCFRPMPDLSEGVWGGLVVLCFWATMESAGGKVMAGWAALTGLALVTLEANRITGAFLLPVLLVATALFGRRKLGRLLLIGLFAAGAYAALCALYHAHTGDWWHELHANLRNKDAKGIVSPPVWMVPFRFLDNLWQGDALAPAYCVLAALGIWPAWRHGGRGGRLVVLWFCVLLLTYSCAPQRLWPYKPMLRDTDRFLAGLAIPMAVLAALGLAALVSPAWLRRGRWWTWLAQRPAIGLAALAALLLAFTARPFFDLRVVREMRRYVESRPEGLRVLSHFRMRHYTHLVAHRGARRLQWVAPVNLLARDPAIEREAAACAELWYARQLLWLDTRFQLEAGQLRTQPPLPTFIADLQREWLPAAVVVKGDNPDLVFFRRRAAVDPPPLAIEAGDAALQEVLPPLPATWQRGQRHKWKTVATVPAAWRGRMLVCELEATSPQPEPCEMRLIFTSQDARARLAQYQLKPYVFPGGGKDFFVFEIPAGAEKCELTVAVDRETEAIEFTGFRATLAPLASSED